MDTRWKSFLSVFAPAFITGALLYIILSDFLNLDITLGKTIFFIWIIAGIVVWYILNEFMVQGKALIFAGIFSPLLLAAILILAIALVIFFMLFVAVFRDVLPLIDEP
jgi:hypothetical protein